MNIGRALRIQGELVSRILSLHSSARAFHWTHERYLAERGKNAGAETWRNAKDEGASSPLLTTPEQIEALRAYVKDFGAWSDEEIAAWSDVECNALFIQLIAGDMREAGLDNDPDESDWQEYQARAETGNCSGNIFRANDGTIYFDLTR